MLVQCAPTQKHDPKTPVESMTVSSSILVDPSKMECSQVFDLLPKFWWGWDCVFQRWLRGIIREHASACDAPG